jgi:hypothetical protein
LAESGQQLTVENGKIAAPKDLYPLLAKLHSLDHTNEALMSKIFSFANAADGVVIDQD